MTGSWRLAGCGRGEGTDRKEGVISGKGEGDYGDDRPRQKTIPVFFLAVIVLLANCQTALLGQNRDGAKQLFSELGCVVPTLI